MKYHNCGLSTQKNCLHLCGVLDQITFYDQTMQKTIKLQIVLTFLATNISNDLCVKKMPSHLCRNQKSKFQIIVLQQVYYHS